MLKRRTECSRDVCGTSDEQLEGFLLGEIPHTSLPRDIFGLVVKAASRNTMEDSNLSDLQVRTSGQKHT